MKPILRSTGAAILFLALEVRPAAAGMPSANLTEIGQFRFEAISFFAVGLIICAAFIQALWNWLGRDFPRLPKLTYGKACAIVVLWGLLFVIVLTMISGARELMTPGAWAKNGSTYKLTSATETKSDAEAATEVARREQLLTSRRKKIRELSDALTQYAIAHDGQFPNDIASSGFENTKWQLPGIAQMEYKYVSGATTANKSFLVAYEPNVFDDRLLTIFVDGRIIPMSMEEILNSIPRGDAQ